MKIKLGIKVRDKVTGFEGIATARIKYLNGCNTVLNQKPQVMVKCLKGNISTLHS